MKKIYEVPTALKFEVKAEDIMKASIEILEEGDGLEVSWKA